MNRKLLASAICASLFVAGAAYAQQDTNAQSSQDRSATESNTQQSKQEPKTLEKVTVTGSLLKRPEYQSTSPVQVVNVQADINAGQFTTADFLQTTAAAAGSTQVNNQFGGFVIEGGTGVQTISLRGLGANRTLVLLDGQRPGPAGTQGQVGAFDLNVIPSVILQRVEIVKDGSSSIYGSDAVAGVVNLITKKRLDQTNMNFYVSAPEHGGGEQYSASLGTGWNFSNGNITFAAQLDRQQALKRGDRDFLSCGNDLVWGNAGQRIDREDRSILQGTDLAGCNNLYANTIIYPWATTFNGKKYSASALRFVPSKDGSTVGPFPGYHPRPYNPTKGRYSSSPNYKDDGAAYYEDVLNFPFYGDAYAISRQTRGTLYGASSFNFGPVDWDTQVLFNRRETHNFGWRQFFPVVYDPASDDYYEPIMPFPSINDVSVDYFYGRTKFAGEFTPSGSWTWEVNATYSRSDGDYKGYRIDAANSGDLTKPYNKLDMPLVNYFDPGILSGAKMQELMNAVGVWTKGNTVYTQSTVNAVVNGNLFELPAGPISAAFGGEYRHYTIDDKPPELTWGYSSASETKGSDNVKEIFGEIGVPLLKGLPAVESLSADLSAREFKYDSVGSSSHVWKYGLNWQIVPTFRVRGTMGTSYRAPGLYELYLGDLSGFLSQMQVDPCINWGQSNNDFLRNNCAAAGIPGDYGGGGSSAQIYQGGGKGFLTPENSRAKSLGFVWSPAFANLNVAVDYFDYHIRGEIGELGAFDILYGCYASPVYPNAFCNMFHRNPANAATDANMITDIHATYVNINSERTRGYDLQMNYSQDFSFGKLKADAQLTYTLEDTLQLFDSAEESGFNTSNFVGYIGRPRMVGIFDASLERGDWTYSWQGIYTSGTSDKDLNSYFTYQGYANAWRQTKVHAQLRHSVSVGFDAGKIGILLGVRNLFDQAPPVISSGVGGVYSGARVGNASLDSSQYDWFGRTYFARLNIKL